VNAKIRSLFACALTAGALVSAAAFASTASAATSMTMEATAYGLTAQDNYPYGATDYFGQPLTAGDIAVDPSVIPLGTCLRVTGYSSPYLPEGGFVGEADDTGGAIQGDHIDIFEDLDNEAEISNFGIQYVQVTILGKSPFSPSQASGTAACKEYETSTSPAATTSSSSSSSSSNSTSSTSSSTSSSSSSKSTSSTSKSSKTSGSAKKSGKATKGRRHGRHHWWGRHHRRAWRWRR
jgi:3D (Asp-Asp-Asp) domain-containing protein